MTRKLHNKLAEKSPLYAHWHAQPMSSIAHFVVLFAFCTVVSVAIRGALPEDVLASTVSTIGESTRPQQSVGDLTSQLIKAAKAYEEAAPDQQGQLLDLLTQVAIARKNAILSAMKKNAGDVVRNALPPGLRQKLPPSILPLLEEEVDAEGTLTLAHIDRQNEDTSEYDYQVADDASGKLYHVHFADGETKEVTGAKVKVNGVGLDQELAVAYAGGSSFQTISSGSVAPGLGLQSTIVIPINFTDNVSQPFTKTQIQGIVFTNADSMNAYFQEDSFGQVSFGGDVTPWFTVPYTKATICSNYSAVMNAANSAATAAGYTLSNYTRRIYVYPNAGCSFGGMSSIGGNPSWSLVTAYGQPYFVQLLEHELGHALGANHASTISCGTYAVAPYTGCSRSEYGEKYDPLGYYNSNHSNAAHKAMFGWLNSSSVVPVSSSGTYTISAIETQTTLPQVLRIPKADTGEYYFIGYRRPIGKDAALPAALVNGATMQISAGNNEHTYFVDLTPGDGNFANAALADGASFTDTANGITITQVSHDATSLTLNVQMSGPTCTPSAPRVSLSPTSNSTGAGNKLTYSLTLTNTDASICPSSTFALTAAYPALWSASFSSASMTLAPDASGSASLVVTSPSAALDGTYSVSAKVADTKASQHSASANATYIVYTPPPDSAPPSISISAPAAGSKLKGANVKINASARDNVGVATISISFDGEVVKTCASTSCSATVQVKSIAGGTHQISASATDTSGNSANTSISVTK